MEKKVVVAVGLILLSLLLMVIPPQTTLIGPNPEDIILETSGNFEFAARSGFVFVFSSTGYYGFNQGIACDRAEASVASVFYSNNVGLFEVEASSNGVLSKIVKDNQVGVVKDGECEFNHIGDLTFDTRNPNGRLILAMESPNCKHRFAVADPKTLELNSKDQWVEVENEQLPYTILIESLNTVYTSAFTNVSTLLAYDADTFVRTPAQDIPLSEAVDNIQGAVHVNGVIYLSLGAFGDTEQYVMSVNTTNGQVTQELKMKLGAETEGISFCNVKDIPGQLHFMTAWQYDAVILLAVVLVLNTTFLTVAIVLLSKAFLFPTAIEEQLPVVSPKLADEEPSEESSKKWKIVATTILAFLVSFGIAFCTALFASAPIHYTYHFKQV